jgi:hypothetical protein
MKNPNEVGLWLSLGVMGAVMLYAVGYLVMTVVPDKEE